MRSTSEPDTIVAVVPAKASWNTMKVYGLIDPSAVAIPSSAPKKLESPISPPTESPNIRAKPNIEYTRPTNAQSIAFFMATATAWAGRACPTSKSRKPGCMRNTSTAPVSTQRSSEVSSMALPIGTIDPEFEWLFCRTDRIITNSVRRAVRRSRLTK